MMTMVNAPVWCSLCHLERYDWSSDITAFDSLLKTVHISGGGNSGSCLPGQQIAASYAYTVPKVLCNLCD